MRNLTLDAVFAAWLLYALASGHVLPRSVLQLFQADHHVTARSAPPQNGAPQPGPASAPDLPET